MSDTKRVLRIHVSAGGKDKVNVRIPLALAKVAGLGGIGERVAKEQGVDLGAILRGLDETPDGKIIDVVDEQMGEHVEIYVETPVSA